MCHDVDCQYLVEHMDRSRGLMKKKRRRRVEERSNWSMWPLPTLLDDESVVAMMLPWLKYFFLWCRRDGAKRGDPNLRENYSTANLQRNCYYFGREGF
jgi:hypothetical protein